MKYLSLNLFFLFLFLVPYLLRAQVWEESEPNNAFSTADSLVVEKSLKGLLFPQNDDDYYRIFIPQEGLFKVRIRNVAPDVLVRLKLYDSSFSEINYKNGQFGQNVDMDTEICDTATYYLRVYALEENSQLTYEVQTQIDSSEAQLSCLTNSATGLASRAAFRFYPNPVHDVLIVDLREMPSMKPGSSFLSLYNAAGELIFRQKVEKAVFQKSLSSLAKGMYLLELQTDRKIYSEKILINTP
ncbi:MAG: T9SS type A sorting domain-containing protein [Bacteroidota bacterium]